MARPKNPSFLKVLAAASGLLLLFWWLADQTPRPWLASLDRAGILLGYLVTGFAAAVAVVSWRLWPELVAVVRGGRTFPGAGGDAFAMKGEIGGIVLPVSRYVQPAWIIRNLEPEWVALLYTAETRETAAQLALEHREMATFVPSWEEITRDPASRFELDLPHDPEAAKRLVHRLLDRLGEPPAAVPRQRLFVDTTGGTAPMSIGAFQAAEEAGVSSIYVLGTKRLEGRPEPIYIVDPDDPTDGRPRFLSDRTK